MLKTLALICSICILHLTIAYGQEIASTYINYQLRLPSSNELSLSGIKRIKATDHYSGERSELSEIWFINGAGLVWKHHLVVDEVDTVPEVITFQYKDSLLVGKIHVADWSNPTYDTVFTDYYYDDERRLIRRETHGRFNHKTESHYDNDKHQYDVTWNLGFDGFYVTDTIFYNENGQPLLKVVFDGRRQVWAYDSNGLLIQFATTMAEDTLLFDRIVKLNYQNKRLSSEEEFWDFRGSRTPELSPNRMYHYGEFYVDSVFVWRRGQFELSRTFEYEKE
jgi:hypothetical protein